MILTPGKQMIVNSKTLAHFIGAERQDKDWTQGKLALTARVSKSTVQHVEDGRHVGNLDTLVRLLDGLGYDLAIVPKERGK